MVALDLEEIVHRMADGPAQVALAASVREAQRALASSAFDAALLDVDVLDGKTFGLAEALRERGMPITFISGSRPEELPVALRTVPFLSKPYDPADIERTLRAKLAPPR